MGDGSAPQRHWLLILDDLHLVSSSEAISLLASILEKGPSTPHMMLLTRDTTSLRLSRLYAEGQVLELTAADLRFTAGEVRQFLAAHGVSCLESELAQIMQRTAGWVATLQLAVNSQRGHGSLAGYLGALRGDGRWLAQYLVQEVLAQQSPAMRTFLLRSSILDSFSAPLADHPPAGSQRKVLEAELLLYRACTHFAEGHPEPAAVLAREAQSHSHNLDPLLVGVLEFLWMHLSISVADETIPGRHAGRALAAFKSANHVTGLIAVRRELALLDMRAGRRAEAGRELDRIAADFGNDPATLRLDLAWVYIYAAEHCYWQDQLDRALHNIRAAMKITSIFQDDELARHLTYLYRLYALRGQHSEANEEESPAADVFPVWYRFVDWQIRWLLATNRIEEAWGVAREYQASLADDLRDLPCPAG